MKTVYPALYPQFERVVMGMGVREGMLSHNGSQYISPIVKQLYEAYKNNTLTVKYVNSLLKSLK